MTPKFRGDSDDWMDDEDASQRSGGAGRKRARKTGEKGQAQGMLDPQLANATVTEVFHKQCEVLFDEDRARALCPYRRAMVQGSTTFGNELIRERSPVAVGDRVIAKIFNPGSGVIEAVCQRKNFLSRPAPGRMEEADGSIYRHVVAANIDILVIVASVDRPEFAPGLVDRYLVAAAAAGVDALVCVSKIDLLKEGQVSPGELYRKLGIDVYEVCAKKNLGIQELNQKLAGRVAAFCGHSGVGKTSLLKVLLGKEVGKIASISESTGKGKHTTTSAIFIENEGLSQLSAHGPAQGAALGWIDTPGIREFGILGVLPEDLRRFFPEMIGLKCAEVDCWHRDEEGCVAKDLLRYSSYRRILESLIAGEN